MINFDLLKKDDYESLFEGFETSFLQIAFKRPTKSLNHYIPNGFRVDKLKRNQMIKVFSDAMIDREPSICGFVSEEIERQFEKAGIFEQVKSLDNSTNSTDRILKISALLWANHLRIPAYLVLLLCGVSCSDDDKTSSIILNKSHTSELDEISKIQYEVGYSHSKAESLEELNTEKKLAEKLERNLLHLKTHIDDIESQKSKTLEDLDSALSVIETLRKQISEDKDNADSLDKQVFRLTNEVSRSNDIIRRQKDDIQDLEKRLSSKPQLS